MEEDQNKYFSISGEGKMPIYKGMMSPSTGNKDMILFGHKLATEWYHLVPTIHAKLDVSFQVRKNIEPNLPHWKDDKVQMIL